MLHGTAACVGEVGIDLTWCEGSTAHGGEVWPYHVIISTLFVTAVFTVQT